MQEQASSRLTNSPFALSLINVITATHRMNFCIISGAGGQLEWVSREKVLIFSLLLVSLLLAILTRRKIFRNSTNVLPVLAKTLDGSLFTLFIVLVVSFLSGRRAERYDPLSENEDENVDPLALKVEAQDEDDEDDEDTYPWTNWWKTWTWTNCCYWNPIKHQLHHCNL